MNANMVSAIPPSSFSQRLSAGAERGVRFVAARVQQPRPAGHQRAFDQRLALPALPVPGHHVAFALQPDAGVPGRPHGAHAHTHRQSHPKPGQLHQVSRSSFDSGSWVVAGKLFGCPIKVDSATDSNGVSLIL